MMASTSTGTDTTDLATTSSYGGDTVTEEDQSDADSSSQDSDSGGCQKGRVAHECSSLRIIENNRYWIMGIILWELQK